MSLPVPQFIAAPKRVRRRPRPRPSGAAPSPPPPVQTVAVLRVYRWGEASAAWVFDKPVANPTGAVDGFAVNGHPGWDWFRVDDNVLIIDHAGSTTVGSTWTNDAGAGGVVGLEGEELVAGSGTVEQE